ncbi:hypothetical protein [Streptomyces sp. NPDC058335]|uniref:hypothetical protein n=1 Tax=Streptomyces sp. NPDC058335 TaxID=3346451 RepID=UPI0036592706
MTESIHTGASLGAQSRALSLIALLAEQHPTLPPAYLTSSNHEPTKISALLDNPAQLEAWREALNVAPEDVHTGTLSGKTTLTFDTALNRVDLHVWVAFFLAKHKTEGAAA